MSNSSIRVRSGSISCKHCFHSCSRSRSYTVGCVVDFRLVKGQAISVRLSEEVEVLVREEAERSGRSRSQVVEELADEAARVRLFPGIGFRGPEPRRAYVFGSGLDVWQIVELLEEYGEELEALLADHPLVDERGLALARAYAERFPEEVALHRRRQRRSLEELRVRYPFIAA